MDTMSELVHDNMTRAQQQQKTWYDKSARKRTLIPGQKVLLLLPTSDNGLLEKWQGPYEVLRKVGETNYELSIPGPGSLFSDRPVRTDVTQHDIRLLSQGPIRQTFRRAPARLFPDLKKEIQAMLDLQVIEPLK